MLHGKKNFKLLMAFGLVAFTPLSIVRAAGPLDQFDALEREMNAAEEAFYKAMDALMGKDGGITPGENTKLPVDGRREVLKKMQSFADENATRPEGGIIMVKTFQWSVNVDPEYSLPWFEKLVSKFPDEPTVIDALDAASFAASMADSQDRWVTAIEKLEGATKVDATKAGALYIAGQVRLSAGKNSDAKTIFEKVVKLSKDEDLTARAKGFLFEIEHLQIGMEAPDFTAKSLDGKEVSLKSLRGKVVLLDFWASWCPPCLGEIPNLSSAMAQLKGANKPFEILSVSVDEDRSALESIIKETNAPGIHTWSEKGGENPAAILYNVRGLPTWYLIDRDGKIRKRDFPGEELVAAVDEILEGKKPTAAPAVATPEPKTNSP